MLTETKPIRKTSIIVLIFLLLHNSTSTSSSPIKTVVVLVMENRSFDHMLGWMKSINLEINGLDGSESNFLSTTNHSSPLFFFRNQSHSVDPDPGHSYQTNREQIFGSDDSSADPPPMNRFAQQAFAMANSTEMPENVMNGFDPEMVAVYKALISEFAVFDRVGLNKFADLTNEEYRSKYLGARTDAGKSISRPKSHRYAPLVGEKLPESVNWKKEGVVVDVKDQRNC